VKSFLQRPWWILFTLALSRAAVASFANHDLNFWHLGAAYKDAPAIGWLTITFLIFVYGCVHVIRKPLGLYLETRSKDIRRQIEEGKIAKLESEEKLRLYEERLKSLDQDIAQLRASFEEQAQAEKTQRALLIKEMETRVLKDADDAIVANFERSKNRLADEVVKRALSMAEETIATKKREQVDLLLQSAFIRDLKTSALPIDAKGLDRAPHKDKMKPPLLAKEVQ